MFCLLKLILMPVLLDCSLGLNDLIVSSRELTVHVGDSALMGCVFKSTEEKRVTKVDWIVSSEHIKDDYVLFYYSGGSVPVGRFLNRVSLVGNISQRDGSLLLQNVKEDDQGNYTCEMRLEMESMVLKKMVVLRVLPEEPKDFVVHVGDTIQMRCVFQSTEERHITKVDWMFWSEEHLKQEAVLHYDVRHPGIGYSQNWGRFQKRVNLVGDISHNDGSIMLQGVKASDKGSYICSIYLGDLIFRKTFVLDVITDTLPIPSPTKPEIFAGNHLVIIVGIVCATIVLLPVLILIVKRTQGDKSSSTATKSLENIEKALPEKHIYAPITTREVTEEEESSGKSEATYMTMHPVRPSLKSAPNNPPEKWSTERMIKAESEY